MERRRLALFTLTPNLLMFNPRRPKAVHNAIGERWQLPCLSHLNKARSLQARHKLTSCSFFSKWLFIIFKQCEICYVSVKAHSIVLWYVLIHYLSSRHVCISEFLYTGMDRWRVYNLHLDQQHSIDSWGIRAPSSNIAQLAMKVS